MNPSSHGHRPQLRILKAPPALSALYYLAAALAWLLKLAGHVGSKGRGGECEQPQK